MTDDDSQSSHAGFLLTVLADKDEDACLRENAAVYLGHMDDPMILAALICLASDADQYDRLLERCGNAIAETWDRNRDFDIRPVIDQVTEPAREAIRGWLNSK
ncbi:hypothetical protein [Mariprofundus ferrooxydans]|nr:hypothetical protein [Mariprofundus ferrooxydans]